MVMSESNAKNEILFYNFHSPLRCVFKYPIWEENLIVIRENFTKCYVPLEAFFFQTYLSLIFICFTNEIRSIK